MIVHKAYRLELDPNNVQRSSLNRAAGARRFAFNWALERVSKRELKPNQFVLINAWNQWKHEGAPWWSQNSKFCYEEAFEDVTRAFQNFFRDPAKFKYPKFARKNVNDRCRFRSVQVEGRYLQLPKIGCIRYKNKPLELPPGIKLLDATVRRVADRWEVSIVTEQNIPDPEPIIGPIVGVDLGLTTFATVGTQSGEVERYQAPKPLKKALRKLRRCQRQLSRSVKGSNRRKRRILRVAKCYRRVFNIRNDFLHKTTSKLARTKTALVVEDLGVANMIRNHKLSRCIADVSWGSFLNMLDYKTRWYGSELQQVDRFYPSSQICSGCGHRQPMQLSQRTYACPQCGAIMDRDDNAAVGLARCYTGSRQHQEYIPPGRGKFTAEESLEHQGDSANRQVNAPQVETLKF
jgi:putative transposase